MTENNNDLAPDQPAEKRVKRPIPDVPAAAPPREPGSGQTVAETPPASEQAQMKMAGEIESGRTPYNYTGEAAIGRDRERAPRFSLANVIVLLVLVALVSAIYMGWRSLDDVSRKLDSVNQSVDRMAGRLQTQSRVNRRTGEAIIRAELHKSLAALEQVLASGNPDLEQRAIRLQGQIQSLLATLGPRRAPVPQAPGSAASGVTLREPAQPQKPAETAVTAPQREPAETAVTAPQREPAETAVTAPQREPAETVVTAPPLPKAPKAGQAGAASPPSEEPSAAADTGGAASDSPSITVVKPENDKSGAEPLRENISPFDIETPPTKVFPSLSGPAEVAPESTGEATSRGLE